MKNNIILCAMVFSTMVTTNLSAVSANEHSYYAQGQVGIGMPGHKMTKESGYLEDKKATNTANYLVALGHKNHHIRYDLSYEYIGNLKVKNDNFSFSGATNNPDTLLNYSQKIKISDVMANIYYDIWCNDNFSTYVGVGVGAVTIKPGLLEVTLKSDPTKTAVAQMSKANNVAFGGKVGFEYKVNSKLSLDAGYKYTNFGKGCGFTEIINLSNGIPVSATAITTSKQYTMDSHGVFLGVRIKF